MKKIAFLIICTISSFSVQSQSPGWLWANSAGDGNSFDNVRDVTTDHSGNVIAVGYFSGISCNFNSTILTSGGSSDMFVVKFDPLGNLLWVKSAGRAFQDGAMAVTTDAAGNIFAAGFFHSDTISFGSIKLANTSGNNCAGLCEDIFMVKYDAGGNVLWAKSAGGPDSDGVNSIAIDASGNIIISGSYSSSAINFGSITLTNTGGGSCVYVAKYDAGGNPIWAKSAVGTLSNYGFATVDASGNVIVSGSFNSPIFTIDTITLINSGSSDFYIAKYDDSGNLLWAKSAGGSYLEHGFSVNTDASGNIIAVGLYSSPTILFGSTTLYGSAGVWSGFIVKYSPSGTVIWANSTNGPAPNNVSFYKSGNVLVSGFFATPSITIGPSTFTNADTLLSTADVYLVNYDTSGNVIWAKTVGGTKTDTPTSITVDDWGSIIFTGVFSSQTITFDSTTLINSNVNGGNSDLFIAKLDTLMPIGINNVTASLNRISVYPNPFVDFTTIETGVFVQNATLTVYNVYGQIVGQQDNLSGNKFTLHRDNLSNGLYFVQLSQDRKIIASNKLVITE